MAQFSFNPTQHKVQAAFEQLPKGWYNAHVVDSSIEPTSKKDGIKLVLTFQLLDGPFAGRKVTKTYNIENPSAEAMRISRDEIATLQAAMGKFVPINDSCELHGLPLQVRLIEQKDSEYNDIKGYRTITGDNPSAGHQAQTPVAQLAQPQQFAPQQYPPQPAAPVYGAPAPQYGAPQPQYAPQQPQGYAQQPQQPYGAPQGAPAYQPQQQQAAPIQAAPPAWAPPQQQQQQQPPAYAQPTPQPMPAQAAPAWQPGAMPPAAPAWAPPQQ